MSVYYLIRLDDACPFMERKKWQRMEDLLDKYNVRPMVGIIPANSDKETMIESEDAMFWEKAHRWEEKGWTIAMHGYSHVCDYQGGLRGCNPMWRRSEFAGAPLNIQKERIKKGYAFLKEKGFMPKYFFAPSHTFDNNTIEALQEETTIRIISDTIGRYPYKHKGFYFIPQIAGHCVKIPLSGIYTFCFHPNTMTDNSFNSMEFFLSKFKNKFIEFENIELDRFSSKQSFDRALSWLFFLNRRIKGKE